MKAFHGDALLKAGTISSVKKKIAAGRLVHGTYGEMMDGVMKGCAVFVSTCNAQNPHDDYPVRYGVPLPIAYLKDRIFEGLKDSPPKDTEWPVKFWQAIAPGADLSLVHVKFMHWLILENLKHEKLWREQDRENAYVDKVVNAIRQVAEVLKKWAETGIIDESAAWSSAWSAEKSARSAWSAEESAAWSAESRMYVRMSEKLLELLREAPTAKEAKS